MPATVAGIHLGPDTHANRPAANAAGLPVGSLYSCTDHGLIYKTDGSSWSTWATLGSAGAFVGAIVSRTATQAITNGAFPVAVSFTAADTIDTDAYHDPASNADRLTIPTGKAGKYRVSATAEFAANATNERFIYLMKNGAHTRSWQRVMAVTTANVTILTGSSVIVLAEADYIGLGVYQNSGGNLNVTALLELEFLGA